MLISCKVLPCGGEFLDNPLIDLMDEVLLKSQLARSCTAIADCRHAERVLHRLMDARRKVARDAPKARFRGHRVA